MSVPKKMVSTPAPQAKRVVQPKKPDEKLAGEQVRLAPEHGTTEWTQKKVEHAMSWGRNTMALGVLGSTRKNHEKDDGTRVEDRRFKPQHQHRRRQTKGDSPGFGSVARWGDSGREEAPTFWGVVGSDLPLLILGRETPFFLIVTFEIGGSQVLGRRGGGGGVSTLPRLPLLLKFYVLTQTSFRFQVCGPGPCGRLAVCTMRRAREFWKEDPPRPLSHLSPQAPRPDLD